LHSAGLDVFSAEPEIPEALRTSRKVSILPHQGTWTLETDRKVGFRSSCGTPSDRCAKMKLRVLANVKAAYETGNVLDIVPELKELQS
jgi:glyoxylate reductase